MKIKKLCIIAIIAIMGLAMSACDDNPNNNDGMVWNIVNVDIFDHGLNAHFRDIAYGNYRWIAVGGGGKIAYSDFGNKWWSKVENSTFDEYETIHGIAYGVVDGNHKWVAVGDEGKMAYSINGETWTAVTDSTFGTKGINSIAYGNSSWVAVGEEGHIAFSVDGEIWTAIVLDTFTNICDVAFGDGRWVVVGDEGRIAFSDDCVTWTIVIDSTFGFGDGIWGIAYGNNRWIAVGSKIAFSDDGETWNRVSEDGNIDIAYGNNKWITVGGKNKYSYNNGVTWQESKDFLFVTRGDGWVSYPQATGIIICG